jgi:hypothetical protein
MPDYNVMLGCPTTRDFPSQYVASLVSTRLHGLLGWRDVRDQAIDVGRNTVVLNFLGESGKHFDYLLMHDSDATWHPEAIERLASRNLPVVTGMIFWRSLPTVPTIGKLVSQGITGAHTYSFAGTVKKMMERVEKERARGNLPQEFSNELLFPKTDDDLEEIDGCGAHFCMIRRDVLEKIKPPWFQCTHPNSGEDFYFCQRVKQAGFKIYVDYSVFTGHVVGNTLEVGLKQFLMFSNPEQIETIWIV